MTVRPTDLADPEWLAATVRRHHRQLGLPLPPERVDLLDVRIKHPHRSESPRCRGWATVRAPSRNEDGDEPVFLIRTEETGPPDTTGTPIPGLPLRAWRFPDDPGLPALKRFVDPLRVRALVPADLAAGRVVEDVRVVRWQPGVSATVRCDLAGTAGRIAVYAKLLAQAGCPPSMPPNGCSTPSCPTACGWPSRSGPTRCTGSCGPGRSSAGRS